MDNALKIHMEKAMFSFAVNELCTPMSYNGRIRCLDLYLCFVVF